MTDAQLLVDGSIKVTTALQCPKGLRYSLTTGASETRLGNGRWYDAVNEYPTPVVTGKCKGKVQRVVANTGPSARAGFTRYNGEPGGTYEPSCGCMIGAFVFPPTTWVSVTLSDGSSFSGGGEGVLIR